VKERPILFSGEMVRKIMTCAKCGAVSAAFPCACGSVDFVKTVTRRVVKPQPGPSASLSWDGGKDHWYADGLIVDCKMGPWRCPFGRPGDRLWVREGYTIRQWVEELGVARLLGTYDADGKTFDIHLTRAESKLFLRWKRKTGRKGSIYMFRSLSRINLDQAGVRVERVREIEHEGAIAEGCSGAHWKVSQSEGKTIYPVDEFRVLWDSINDKNDMSWKTSWEANPWVWVIEFRRVK
jgi:hypothetical protein